MPFDILFDFDSIRLFEEAMQQAPKDFADESLAAAQECVGILREPLAEYPEPPTYPIQWDSERQRRAFFATDGFGGGIPYERQGALPNSWRTQVDATPTQVRGQVFTNAEAAVYVQDRNRQSRIHAGRWQTIQGDLAENRARVIDRFREAANKALGRIAERVRSYTRIGD